MGSIPSAIPFSESLAIQHPFGQVVAVHLPEGLLPVPEETLSLLPVEERSHAMGLRGRRQIEWVGGRLALRLAAQRVGMTLPAILPGARGEPLLPVGVTASISHKKRVAMALVGTGGGTVGIDAEELHPPRMAILSRVLREEEQEEVAALPEADRWESLVSRFAIKEAIYKALHPHVVRYVRFDEARVGEIAGGEAHVCLHLQKGEGPFAVEARVQTSGDLLIAMVRVSRTA